ncbi:hypothetical protein Ahy_B03g067441 [Arachis hypogaea]|uniref:PB1-like domain-containing protein n=1 Tax=Arachis hypogaea TaxID=3818 RepID=A0A445A6T9_ARAHY|nr:hypothetical protein Ahy_B03g067441 [Arachis hypogaea]
MKGQATVVKDIDGDWWSVFEAYEELRQFGYLKFTIAALWYKDATANDSKSHLKLLKGDSEAIEMCSIAGKRGFVDLFVVHEVGDAERFSEEGQIGSGDHYSSSEDSDDLTYLSSNEKGVSAKDIHFTDSEEVYDYESGFGEENSVPKDSNAEKGKRVVTSDLDDEEAADSDHLEQDHMIGGQDLRGDYTEEDAYCEGQKFRVYKPEKDMGKYKWKVGTLYESRQEFKDTVAAFAVQTARNIKFKKCDLVRVQAVCQKNFPFWLYAHKVGEESTWKLRSMNLQHTYMQTHRVGIMHSKWPGTQFKKKVESDRRIKVKDLVAKAHKKWNLTVTKSMTAKTKQEVLSQIQGAFREQYRRINDYCGELLRINPGSTKEAYLTCYQEVIHPVDGPDLWERTQYDDVMPPPYRRPSHRPVKKRKQGPADEDNRSQNHLSRRGQVQRCSNCGAVGHKKGGCTKPKKKAPASTKRRKKDTSKLVSGQIVQTGKKRKTALSLPHLPATQPRKSNPRPKKPAVWPNKPAPQPKKASTQPNTQAQPKNKAAAAATFTSNKQFLSQPLERKRHFSVIQSGAPHVPLHKLKLIAKLPPSEWGNL